MSKIQVNLEFDPISDAGSAAAIIAFFQTLRGASTPLVALSEKSLTEVEIEKIADTMCSGVKAVETHNAPVSKDYDNGYQYSEEELINMKEINSLAESMGINLSEYPGKNTNKKVRDLILASYAGDLKEDTVSNDVTEDQTENNVTVTDTTEPVKDTKLSLEEVRAVLTKKTDAHREAIKAKLTALGAKNLTTLDAKHYEEVYEFLTALA